MAGTGGASMVENEGSRVVSCDSENGNKRIEFGQEGEDRFSALPDFLIHRILSFLPATDLVKTLILSKWWKSQWTHVPVLRFVPNAGMSPDKFSNFIDKTLILHDCSNIDKFVINIKWYAVEFPNFDLWIDFAVRKDVKELILKFNNDLYLLPEFLFDNSSLVKVELSSCYFVSIKKVNWDCVKSLSLYGCGAEDKAIENVLFGSPVLEYLELCRFDMYGDLAVASKSLKTLILNGVKSDCSSVEILCPNLQRLRISGLVWFKCLKLMDLPSSVYATLDFFYDIEGSDDDVVIGDDMSSDDCINLVQKILRQVEHVEKLEIGGWMMEMLSSSEEDGDCIGGLPDDLIHRIISFFPSIKDAFKSDFFKTWQHRWTHDVPILDFVSNEKLVIDSKDIPLVNLDPRLSLWIRFAARKNIKELILDCYGANVELGDEYPLPEFLFNNSSLVRMKICACEFMPDGNVNWESLKSLHLEHSELRNQAIERVLSGSPLLESLELHNCGIHGALVIASQHLKNFLLDEFGSECPILEISCPNLDILIMRGNLGSIRVKFTSLPSSLHAILDLYVLDISFDDYKNLVEETMKQIMHVEALEIKLRRLKS